MITMRMRVVGLDRLRDLARAFPSKARRVWYYIARKYRDELRDAVASQGGLHGVPKWSKPASLTRALRRRNTVGGVLARRENIVMFRRGSAQQIGWRSSLAPYAEALQTAERRGWSAHERAKLRAISRKVPRMRRLISSALSAGYSRPARPVIEPFARHVQATISARVAERIDKVLAR